jgi:hypothetical protein
MSEENQQNRDDAVTQGSSLPEFQADESYDVTLNKTTSELTIRDPNTGRIVTLKTKVVESPEETETAEEFKPLPPDDFRNVLARLDALGLTWTADRIPRVVAKESAAEDAFLSDEFQQLQSQYPTLPRELSAVIFHALTGMPAIESVVGTKDDLNNKVAAVREFIITPDYRSEFFFKYAIKVPYFESIDWEVLFKTHERNVTGIPGVSYALLMLTFHNPNPRIGDIDKHQNVTVAADLKLVDNLISTLIDVKTALEDAGELASAVNKGMLKGEGHAEHS